MVVACCVCRRAFDVYYNLSFHTFPFTDEKKKELWCSSMGLSILNVKKHWKICGLHFTEDDYKDPVPGNNKKFLKKDAVPSIIHISEEEINKNSESMIQRADAEDSENWQENESQENQFEGYDITENVEDNKCIETVEHLFRDETAMEYYSVYTDDTVADVKLETTNTAQWEDLPNSPDGLDECFKTAEEIIAVLTTNFETAKERVALLNRKLIRERVRNTRLRKVIRSFQATTQELKPKHFSAKGTSNELSIKQSLPPAAEIIFRRMLSKKKGRYPAALKSFATTLYSHSPKAYDYVRENCLTILPHSSTLKKW